MNKNMKVILYMAITANGFIAKENDDTGWVTETEWESFSGMIRKNGNMIIGKRTYEIMVENDEFGRSNLNEIKTVVLTNDTSLEIHNPEFISIATSPKEAINILHEQGFETIMVCGGGGSNASFMKENLIDEIYLDVEPIVFGKGIRLFAESDFEAKLKLLETKKLSDNEIQLHYQVLK
jgi:dihydrofolate reductase